MTTVEFHILKHAGDEARLKQVCQLVEQAQQQNQRVFIRSDATLLTRLDDLLWTFHDQAFIPHERITPDEAHPRTVALLGTDEPLPDGFTTLINVHDALPPQWTNATIIHEVIDADPAAKQQGRERFKAYRDLGCSLQTVNH